MHSPGLANERQVSAGESGRPLDRDLAVVNGTQQDVLDEVREFFFMKGLVPNPAPENELNQ